MRYLVLLVFWLFPLGVFAQNWEDRRLFLGSPASQVLRIISSTDTALFAPIIEGFMQGRADVTIEYLVTSTAELDKIVRQNPDHYDLVISSAMDLQLKLANDGFALRLDGIEHPELGRSGDKAFLPLPPSPPPSLSIAARFLANQFRAPDKN